jgi:membrane protein required for colicin V production
MVIADLIIILVLAGFAIYGWKSGLISAVGRIAGIFVGAFIAGQYYTEVASYFAKISFGSEMLQNAIAFIVLFGITSQLIGLIFYSADKVFNVVAIIPGLKSINRIGGAILGILEGALVISVVLYIAYLFPFSALLDGFIIDSAWAHFFIGLSNIIGPFIPDSLEAVRTFIF